MGVVIRRWVYIVRMYRCDYSGWCCKDVCRFPHITYPYILHLYYLFFAAASLLIHFINVFLLFVKLIICSIILAYEILRHKYIWKNSAIIK